MIKYSLFFRDPNSRPRSWVLYGTNNKNLIPNGRASARKGFHAQKNIWKIFDGWDELDTQSTTNYINTGELYSWFVGRRHRRREERNAKYVLAKTNTTNLRNNSFEIDYKQVYEMFRRNFFGHF